MVLVFESIKTTDMINLEDGKLTQRIVYTPNFHLYEIFFKEYRKVN